MKTWIRSAGRTLQRLAGQVDVLLVAAGQRGDDRPPDLLGDLLHAPEVALGGGGEAGLDDVHAQLVELPGEPQLLLGGHRVAGGLLAVAKRGVENQDFPAHRALPALPVGENEKRRGPSSGSAASGDCLCAVRLLRALPDQAANPAPESKLQDENVKDEQQGAGQHRVSVPYRKAGQLYAPGWMEEASGRVGRCQGAGSRGSRVVSRESRVKGPRSKVERALACLKTEG